MPALPALPLLLPLLETPSLLDLAKIFGVPASLFLLARYFTLRDKRREETAKEGAAATAEATRVLKQRSETAEHERETLRADSDKNKAEHERFHQLLHEMRATTQLIQNDVQAMKMDAARSDMRSEGFKETLSRIDGQLGRLIDNYRSLS